jgi:hypothetical protein
MADNDSGHTLVGRARSGQSVIPENRFRNREKWSGWADLEEIAKIAEIARIAAIERHELMAKC